MKKLYLILFMLSCCGSIMAEDVLQIIKRDGQTHTINLNEKPETTFKDGNLIITTLTATISYPLETVKRFVYFSGTDEIQNIKGEKFEISHNGKMLTFSGLDKDAEARIISASGLLVKRIPIAAQSKTQISLDDMPLGVYFIKVNGITYKILNR